MINIEYSNEGGIKVTVQNLQDFNPNFPYRLNIRKHVSGEIQWSTDLLNNSWAAYPSTEMFDAEILDREGNPVFTRRWDLVLDGSIFYKSLWAYCKGILSSGRFPKGIVIGTHDGEFGEWVPVVLKNLSKVVLVEASDKQFDKLDKNYRNNPNVVLVKNLITPDGGEVEFFEGGEGYTNTVVEKVIRHWETEEIHSSSRESISIDDLINTNYPEGFDWLHLDVEGLDAKLIRGISKEKNLPKFIIFEDYNLSPSEKEDIFGYLKNRGYNLHPEGGICQAIKIR